MLDPSRIIYEDGHVLAINKPSGLLMQAGAPGVPTLDAEARHHLAPDDPSGVYLGTVHRIDRPVSGVTVWAKTPKAARRLAEQFADRSARKRYWAVVEDQGGLLADEGVWEDGLTPPDATGRVTVVAIGAAGSRPSRTRFRRGRGADTPAGTIWVEFFPETGRTHQLRVQAASRGWPIVGDVRYGASRPFPDGVALHARALSIRHPTMRHLLELVAPLPLSWAEGRISPPVAG